MTITCSQLHNYFNQILKPELFDDYCPNGLQISGKETIKKIAFAVSATKSSIKEAAEWGADALIVHHGVFWKYQSARPIVGPWGERIKQCIQNDMNLFAYHLPLDGHLEIGNAASVAHLLNLSDIAPFGEYKKTYLGVKGKFSEAVKASDLKLKLSEILSHTIIHASPDDDQMISSIGIITGGANNEWTMSISEEVDAYLTGEISEYNWHDAIEAGIHYFAGGHHATEKFGIQSLMKEIKSKYPALETMFFDSNNPA